MTTIPRCKREIRGIHKSRTPGTFRPSLAAPPVRPYRDRVEATPVTIEGIVTTRGVNQRVHVSPMGPEFDGPDAARFRLRPFPTSGTYSNLVRHPEGVFHVTEDVLTIARAATGRLPDSPPCDPAEVVAGFLLRGYCRAYEFRVVAVDASRERVDIEAEVVRVHRGREWSGFNRAKNAVLEAAILATRFHIHNPYAMEGDFERFRTIVAKTGGPDEREAMELLYAEWRERVK